MKIYLTYQQFKALTTFLEKNLKDKKYRTSQEATLYTIELSQYQMKELKKYKLPLVLARVFKEINKKTIEKSDLKKWIRETTKVLRHSETKRVRSAEYLDGGYNMLKVLSKKYQLGFDE